MEWVQEFELGRMGDAFLKRESQDEKLIIEQQTVTCMPAIKASEAIVKFEQSDVRLYKYIGIYKLTC